MSKFILLILFFAQLSLAYSQDLKPIEITESQKTLYIGKVLNLDDYCIYFEKEGDTTSPMVRYDLGTFQFFQTKSMDTILVFDGKLCGGHEKGVVNIYQLIKGTPETILSRPGKIASLEGDTAWIYTYPCCAQILNIIVPFSLLTGKKLGIAHVFYSRNDYATIFPIEERENQRYQLANDTQLHWSPSETEESYTPICGNFKFTIYNAPKGTEFTLIEVTSNDWVLIRIEDAPLSKAYCISEYNRGLIDGGKFVLYGWVPVKSIKWE